MLASIAMTLQSVRQYTLIYIASSTTSWEKQFHLYVFRPTSQLFQLQLNNLLTAHVYRVGDDIILLNAYYTYSNISSFFL